MLVTVQVQTHTISNKFISECLTFFPGDSKSPEHLHGL